MGYRLAGGKVVFEFAPGSFAEVTRDMSGEHEPLSSFEVTDVHVAGEFNDWSKSAWPMRRSGDRWRLTRAAKELGTARTYQFKFVVNGAWWVEPPVSASNGYDLHFMNGARNLVLTLH